MSQTQAVQKADAVFEGGGVKGMGLVGALSFFEEQGFQWQNLAGTSAGSIVATLVAVGYDASELKKIMTERVNFAELKDTAGIGKLGRVGPWLSLLFSQGMYQGDFFLELMRDLIQEKTGNRALKFGDLIVPQQPGESKELWEEKYKYRLRVIASDISSNNMLALPQAIKSLGLEPDQLEVAMAVRMSVSFPYFFKPVRFREGAGSQRVHWIVDGGMLSNFPVWLFDSPAGVTPSWPTIGFLLAEPQAEGGPYQKIGGLASMTKAMVQTMSSFYDRKAMEESDKTRVVSIPTGKYSTLDFELDDEGKKWLYESGRTAARDFLAAFSWEAYKETQMAARGAGGRGDALAM
jgi:NTE family protein